MKQSRKKYPQLRSNVGLKNLTSTMFFKVSPSVARQFFLPISVFLSELIGLGGGGCISTCISSPCQGALQADDCSVP